MDARFLLAIVPALVLAGVDLWPGRGRVVAQPTETTLAASMPRAPSAGALPQVVYPDARGTSDQAVTRRERTGHFVFEATVNGAALPMMFDTGATMVVLRAEDAARLGLDPDALRYTALASTANGKADVAPVMIKAITIGGITRRNVPALVSRPGSLPFNLLGQSFLTRLAGYKLEGEKLILDGGR